MNESERKRPRADEHYMRVDQSGRAERRVVVLAYPQMDLLDFAAVVQTFHLANVAVRELKPSLGLVYQVVVASTGEATDAVSTGCGVPVLAAQSLSRLRGAIDTVVVPGGESWALANDDALIKRFVAVARRSRRVAAVCTGAFLLADAGLLAGKQAATHWRASPLLRQQHADVNVQDDAIFVQQGNVFTSAGSTASLDLMLHLIELDQGHRVAMHVARDLVMFLRRPGGQSQFSETLRRQSCATDSMADLLPWIADHLDDDLRVEVLAERCHMSLRNFVRQFPKAVGQTPAKYVETVRIESAKRRLEQSSHESLDEIARSVGLGSADVLCRSFRRVTGVTPSHYAATFGRSHRAVPHDR